MNDVLQAFAISASGMAVERLRLEVAATNLANAHTTRAINGQPYRPLRVVSHAASVSERFEQLVNSGMAAGGVDDVAIVASAAEPRLEYDPGNPDADSKGFVALPQVNPLTEMVSVVTAVRSYEANVRAMNAAKAMALKALEIGDVRP